MWQVNAADAEVIANGKMNDEDVPLLATKGYGEGRFIYHGAIQPLIGHGGYDSGMYSYVIYRRAIEWAFEAARVPIVKLSPWHYRYDAAFVIRHDFENFVPTILSIESSAQFEDGKGAKGDYYFCTGVIRLEDSADHRLTDPQKTDAQESVKQAVVQYGATIGSHNGGKPNPVESYDPGNYNYWHWGPDEALDTKPDGEDGKEYAQESIEKSFEDIEEWLPGHPRVWVSPAFNSTREDSYEILQQLDVLTVGEQKLGVFPHRTVSTRTLGKRYSHLTLPVSEWYVGTEVAQAMDYLPKDLRASSGYKDISSLRAAVVNLHSPTSLEAAVDFYYDLGALINIYSHLPTNEEELPQRYVTYNLSKPGMWATNAICVHKWWSRRSNVTVEPSYSMSGSEGIVGANITGATDPETAVEVVLPNRVSGSDVEVSLNGATADPSSYRLTHYGVKVKVGITVSDLEVRYTPLQILKQA